MTRPRDETAARLNKTVSNLRFNGKSTTSIAAAYLTF